MALIVLSQVDDASVAGDAKVKEEPAKQQGEEGANDLTPAKQLEGKVAMKGDGSSTTAKERLSNVVAEEGAEKLVGKEDVEGASALHPVSYLCTECLGTYTHD